MMGDLKIQSLAKPDIKCLSEIISAHGEITKEMVTEQGQHMVPAAFL